MLLAFGVPEDQVIEDYLLTNPFRAPINEATLNVLVSTGRLGNRVYLEPQIYERAEYLEGTLEELHLRYGSFEAFAEEALGITADDLELIRENLLEG